jgi:2-dehydropantoate 2-reductase
LEIRSGQDTTILQPVTAVASPIEAAAAPELVLFTVKTYDTAPAAAALRPALGPGTMVLPLQNGIDSTEQLATALGPEPVLAGTTFVTAVIAEPGVISFTPPSRRIVFGEPSGRITPRVEQVATCLEGAGIEVVVSPDPRQAIWQKFIPLAAFASLGSAAQASVGAVREVPEGVELLRQLISEVVAVGRAEGVALPADAEDAAVDLMLSVPAALRNSMERDFERQRRVELEQITGTVTRRGRAHDVPTPIFDALYAVLKIRARGFGGL